MVSNIVMWWVLTFFFFVTAVLYTGWNIIAHPDRPLVNAIEWAGSVALLCTMLMTAMIAFYLQKTYKAQGGALPEDVVTSDIDDGDPEVGEFSPWSWWPVALAGAAAIFVVGLAVGQFLLPVGLGVFVIAIVGWTYEYYRGHFAR